MRAKPFRKTGFILKASERRRKRHVDATKSNQSNDKPAKDSKK